MKIKGLDRERKRLKRRFGMQVDNASVRRVQLALIQRPHQARKTTASIS